MRKLRKLSNNLIQKSTDAFLLSLELYNKPTIRYRAESFSMLFSNAWELLLKAYLFEQAKGKRLSIFRRKRRKQKRESISLDECLNRVFNNNNDPVKKNVEYISEIRNEASHLVIPELDPFFSRVFQAGINNYVKNLFAWFSVDINAKLNPGLVSLITDKDRISDVTLLKGKYPKEDFESIVGWIDRYNNLTKLGEQAALTIRHTVAIVKNPSKADYVISSGQTGKAGAVIIEKTKSPDITHPYNRKTAIVQIRSRIARDVKFTEYDFEAFVFVKGYKKTNNEYYYKGKFSGSGQYSEKFIDGFVQSITGDIKALDQWRSQYRQHIKRNK